MRAKCDNLEFFDDPRRGHPYSNAFAKARPFVTRPHPTSPGWRGARQQRLMPAIRVTVPGLLRHTIGEQPFVTIDATTLRELITKLQKGYPLLRSLIWDEQLVLRQHVLIFLNDTATKWLETLDVELKEGDTVAVMQAISGG
jgi:molybdopterin converting factor small subunit